MAVAAAEGRVGCGRASAGGRRSSEFPWENWNSLGTSAGHDCRIEIMRRTLMFPVLPLAVRWCGALLLGLACATSATAADPQRRPFEASLGLGAAALAQATAQAHAYARALGVRSCVVAAPPGLWLYSSAEASPVLVRQITSLELHQRPDDVPRLIVNDRLPLAIGRDTDGSLRREYLDIAPPFPMPVVASTTADLRKSAIALDSRDSGLDQ